MTADDKSQALSALLQGPLKIEARFDLQLYDMVFNISNLEKVVSRDKGWPVKIQTSDVGKALRDDKLIKVEVMGVYNRGKTYVASKLSGRTINPGNLIHTEGLSCLVEGNFVYMDTAGQNRALNLQAVDDGQNRNENFYSSRLMSDLFMTEIMINLSDVIVVLVNQLTLEDQRYVRMLEKHGGGNKIITVNNLKEIYTARFKQPNRQGPKQGLWMHTANDREEVLVKPKWCYACCAG